MWSRLTKSVGGDIPTNILKEYEFKFAVLAETSTFPDY